MELIVYKYKALSMVLFVCTLLTNTLLANENKVLVATIDGAINPVTTEYTLRVVRHAEEENYEALILQMDTPGGLLESTRLITKEFLATDVPVIVFVYPSGSRAASAGVFISYAAHFVAMAPSTNIGAAHPVTLQGGADSSQTAMMEKITNDAVAQIKGLAKKRGRNIEWAEKAVRESVSITADEALELNVINFISPNLDSLLSQLDGKITTIDDQEYILHTKNAAVVHMEMTWRDRVLSMITNPNIAYFLLMIAMWGIFFELSNPGSIFPGVIGAIALLIFLYSTQTLPVNYAGLALIVLAVVLFILEVKITSFGLLTLGGIVAMILGSLMLFETPDNILAPAMSISLSLVITFSIVTAILFLLAVGLALKARQRKVTTGAEGILGEKGIARSVITTSGQVQVHGEIWSAYAEEEIPAGSAIRILQVEGLKVKVEKV
ncbi:MAG: nodulation protein NfeD [Deferribacteres bacterium]|nr:nodulation protein NfeD [candidate division KSB1 bacterium]MCB9501563.1 nodulation protein NfeD [Deferribacteres bacterium]